MSESTTVTILQQVGLSGISLMGDANALDFNLTDILQLTYGPRENNDGVRSCLTYNPPGSYKPGAQQERSVSKLVQYLQSCRKRFVNLAKQDPSRAR